MDALPQEGPYDCTACGACCIVAGKVEVRAGETIPTELLDTSSENPFMARYMGGRCKALTGVIGECVGCTIYSARPSVCASFQPGSEGCKASREVASHAMRSTWRRRGYGKDWQETV